MGRLQTFLITLVVVLIFIAVKSAGLISSAAAGSAASGHPVTPTPVPTPSLSPISWTIEPESSAEAPVLRGFILARIEVPVPGAKWYKVERVTDAEGTAVVADDPYYPQWFDQQEHVFRFVSTHGRSSAQDGPLYLRVSAWSRKEEDGGARVSAYSDVLAVYYDHAFENLEFDIEVAADEQRPGDALLRAVPRDAGLAAQIELYAWVYYTPNADGTFRSSGPVYQTAKPGFRVSFSEPGIKYVGLYGAWNGSYGWTAYPTTDSGVKSRPAPYVGTAGSRHFAPVALVVDPESGPPVQVAPGFDGPQYQLAQIAGDLRFPLDKDEISNPEFEEGFAHWSPGHYPPGSSGSEAIVAGGCRSSQCLRMQHNDSTWEGTSQSVGKLVPGGVYQLQAWFKTAPLHYGYINLHDPDWKNADCQVVKRSLTVLLQGDGNWRYIQERIRIPETDDCGESTADHTWRVYLYGYHPVADNSPIYYDDISLLRLTDFAPPNTYTELEEQDGWQAQCQRFADGMPLTPCPAGFVGEDRVTKLSSAFARVLHGDRAQQTTYALALPVKPNTTYRIAFSLKIADRAVYNYLNLDYPQSWVQQRPGLRDTVEGTKGIWSGKYLFEVDGVNLLSDIAKDAEYRSPSDVAWFREEHYFQTGPNQVEAVLRVRQQGFDGKLYLDGLTVQEVDSAIADRYFHIPLATPFKGMRIVEVSREPLQVQTNAARFAFTANAIEVTHNQGYSFQATTTTRGLDPRSGKVVAVGQSVLVAVTPALRKGRVLVWALVANGTLTKALTF